MRNLLKRKKQGFTLVEILVVIVVIGLLFMFFVPRIDFVGDKARETGVKSDLGHLVWRQSNCSVKTQDLGNTKHWQNYVLIMAA